MQKSNVKSNCKTIVAGEIFRNKEELQKNEQFPPKLQQRLLRDSDVDQRLVIK